MSLDLSSLEITDSPDGCIFAVKVVPGSSRNRIVGTLGGSLKVAVSSPPEKGAANKALLSLLAKHLGLRPAQLLILSGHSHPRKRLLAVDLTARQLRTRWQSL